jgi:hypothetical protein
MVRQFKTPLSILPIYFPRGSWNIASLELILVLAIGRYEWQAYRSLLGQDEFYIEREWLDLRIGWHLEFWHGLREPAYVPEDETWKCRYCAFAELCPAVQALSLETEPKKVEKNQGSKEVGQSPHIQTCLESKQVEESPVIQRNLEARQVAPLLQSFPEIKQVDQVPPIQISEEPRQADWTPPLQMPQKPKQVDWSTSKQNVEKPQQVFPMAREIIDLTMEPEEPEQGHRRPLKQDPLKPIVSSGILKYFKKETPK